MAFDAFCAEAGAASGCTPHVESTKGDMCFSCTKGEKRVSLPRGKVFAKYLLPLFDL